MKDLELMSETSTQYLDKVIRTLNLRAKVLDGDRLTDVKDVKIWNQVFKQYAFTIERQYESEG